MGKMNPDMRIETTKMNTLMKCAWSCVSDTTETNVPSARTEAMKSAASAATASNEPRTGSAKTQRESANATTKSSTVTAAHGIILPATRASREMGVAQSCSIVCCSFSRTIPVARDRLTSMMTIPIVPGRKKSESRRCGLKRTVWSSLMGFFRTDGVRRVHFGYVQPAFLLQAALDLGAEEGPVLIAHRHREVVDPEPQGEAEEEEHDHRQDDHVADQPGVSPDVDELLSDHRSQRSHPGPVRAAGSPPRPVASRQRSIGSPPLPRRRRRGRVAAMAPESMAGCLEHIRDGGCVLVVDSAAEPPEAVLACAAARVTPATINFLVTHARGLVCLVLPPV